MKGPRKAKEKAKKDARENLKLHTCDIVDNYLTFMLLAWFEAERKKRPRSPNAEGSENEESSNRRKKAASTKKEGMWLLCR